MTESTDTVRSVSPLLLASDNPLVTASGRPFATNRISTQRYNLLNYLPIALLIQFSRVANCFYLVSAILQSIPDISTNDPLATLIPLAYVIILGIIKEGIADYKRYKNDKQVNDYPCTKLELDKTGFATREVKTSELKVGDLIRVKDG